MLAEKLNTFVFIYLDDIFVYMEDPRQGQVKAVWWILEIFRKYGLYANLKKCYFHQDEIRFLAFVIFKNRIRMKEKKINTVKKWFKP